MPLKLDFSDRQKYGLNAQEVKVATSYLRKHKTTSAVPDVEALKLYEMYMIGCSFSEIQQQFPQYPLGQIIMTAAIRGWAYDREMMMTTLKDRVHAKVIKSVLEQVDFLTSVLSVANVEFMTEMQRYLSDPSNAPRPKIAINNMKEYKEAVETLSKIVQKTSANAPQQGGGVFDSIVASQSDRSKRISTPRNKQDDSKMLDIKALAAMSEDEQ
jgi:hypothetical protein